MNEFMESFFRDERSIGDGRWLMRLYIFMTQTEVGVLTRLRSFEIVVEGFWIWGYGKLGSGRLTVIFYVYYGWQRGKITSLSKWGGVRKKDRDGERESERLCMRGEALDEIDGGRGGRTKE